MTRATILAEAGKLISGDRARDYGDASANFGRVAGMWSAYLGAPVTPTDVCLMLAMLKVARLKQSPLHRDSWADGCGYLALGAEVAGIKEPNDGD